MRKIRFNKKTKNIVLIVLSCIMLFGAIFGLVALFRQDKTTKEINPTYSVGALNATTGKYEETKSAIYTKEGFECQGLTTSLEFDAVVKYQLYFYSEYDEFIHTTGTLSGTFYSNDIPVNSKYARVVIIPNEDENISWLEKFNYSKQLNIEVDKEQNFKSLGQNLYIQDTSFGVGDFLSRDDGVSVVHDANAQSIIISESINIGSKHRSLFISTNSPDSEGAFGLYMYDLGGNFISFVHISTVAEKIYSVSTGGYHYVYKLSDNVGSVKLMSSNDTLEFYLF